MNTPSFSYNFAVPRQIVFGWGRRREIGELATSIGRRAWIICGSNTVARQGYLSEIRSLLHDEMIESDELARIGHEPEVTDVDLIVARLMDYGIGERDFLLAVGGGAAIDLAKAVAAMATNRQSSTIKDYLEGVGKGLSLQNDPLPVIAIPTTAGTGAEATKNAVISSYAPPYKKSLRDDRLMPRLALVDPELTVTAPAKVTAASGMDAITQLIESCLSLKAQPIPQALAMQGLRLAVGSILEATRDPSCRPARERMAHAALLSGIALANSGLGMAHGVAAALGVHCRVPHGIACAVMLPAALRVNSHERQRELAYICRSLFPVDHTLSDEVVVGLLIERIETLCGQLKLPGRLSELGVTEKHIADLVDSSHGSSMSGNPVELTDEQLSGILYAIL